VVVSRARADNAEDFADVHLKRDIFDGGDGAIRFIQVFDVDHGSVVVVHESFLSWLLLHTV
jgi:hypothetical protein